jgi:biotin transport system substrate-specific component
MSVQVRSATLAEAVVPRSGWLARDALIVLAAGTLMAAFARITIPLPFTPVPLTGQTLGVLLAGAALGSRRGSLAMLAYLGEGLAGLPVFSGGMSAWSPSPAGVPWIIGPTAGYLWSYPLAAFVVGFLAERGWDRNFFLSVVAMLVGSLVIYAVGVSWLGVFVGPERALMAGMLPFIPGDIAKLLVAAAVLPSAWRFVQPGAGMR